ncbi:hypothetical protein OIU77_021999 [Salix suchowensis]|uniref:Pectinesterase catalytic domain-containing protein n=1 Tax=Salix suchowensis TaxID=1278906 RepID=A0ABQ9CBT7_9ROSI|nr:hypothetical protein OIU77_021999 [Salix suchowensis]
MHYTELFLDFKPKIFGYKTQLGHRNNKTLRVGADHFVINLCRIDAYQGTLFAPSPRQLYRNCYITGTVDFLCGNAAVELQNCKLVPRKPMSGQNHTVKAHGRAGPNQDPWTSIQIQKCDTIGKFWWEGVFLGLL